MADLPAGLVLRAVEALQEPDTFTPSQRALVAVLLHLAFESGRAARFDDELAELRGCWADHNHARRTWEDQVAARLADMEQAANADRLRRQLLARRRGPLDGVDWPPVARPGVPQQRGQRRAAA